MSYAGEELYDVCYLAPLGEEGMLQMYKVQDEKLDVFKTNDGVGCSLNWDRTETKIYVYPFSSAHYSEWLGICLIQDGEADTGPLDDVQHSFGKQLANPLWILPGSELLRRRLAEVALEDRE